MKTPKNIIIGAGISGLSCAAEIKDCIVFEKEPSVGGLSRTFKFKGLSFDIGGHRFISHNSETEKLFKNIVGDTVLKVKRKSRIYRKGRFINYPLEISIIFDFNPLENCWAVITYLYRKVKPLKGSSFMHKATNRFGDYLYNEFFRDYTQKVWGLDCKDISEELVNTRLQNVSLMRVLKYALFKKGMVKSFASSFLYPAQGIAVLPNSLSRGLDIRLNSNVTGLLCSGKRIEKIVINNSQEYPCGRVVSTMPITELIKLLNAPVRVRDAAASLKYRDLICVFLRLKKRYFSESHWIYFPGRQIFGRLHEPKNWSHKMADDEQTGICLEIFCNRHDDIWKAKDEKIASEVIEDLPLLDESEVEDFCVLRITDAYPVFGLGYRQNLESVRQFLSSYENLFILGRTGSFKYSNMDACLEEGRSLGKLLKSKSS